MHDAVDHNSVSAAKADGPTGSEPSRRMTVASAARTAGWVVAGMLLAVGIVDLLNGGRCGIWWLPILLLIVGIECVDSVLRRQRRRLAADAERELAEAEAVRRRESDLAAAEERILSDVRGCQRLKSALSVLFQHLVPSPRDGFACFLQCRDELMNLRVARGLSLPISRDLVLEQSLLRRIRGADFLRLTADEIRTTQFAALLSSDDRRKIRRVFVFRVGDADRPVGIVISTRLFADPGDVTQQIPEASAMRVLRESGTHLLKLIERDDSKDRNESQTALRGLVQPVIADSDEPESRPTGHVLLAGLRELVAVDRVSVYSINGDPTGDQPTLLMQSGPPVPPAVERLWEAHESTLLEQSQTSSFSLWNSTTLRTLGIDSIINSAAVAGFTTNDARRTVLVLSHRGRWQPSPRDERLIAGCCQLLGERNGLRAATPADGRNSEVPVETQPAIGVAPISDDRVVTDESRTTSLSAREEFLAVMSHELRSPVSAILGMTELALAGNLPAEQRQYLSLVQSSSESMLTMLNDVLDLAKLEAGALQPERIEFRPRSLVGDALKSIAFKAHEKRLELCLGIARDVPHVLVGDPTRLRQVIVNLVSNATRFTKCGEVAVRVDVVHVERDRCRLRFAVRDTGCGIPQEVQDRIFSKYAQADATVSRHYGGTGLGLAISREIVEMMGGTIAVSSKPGRGSTFHFEADFEVAASAGGSYGASREGLLMTGSVLVVDDHLVTRGNLAEAVESLHWDCRLAANVDEAVRFLEESSAVLLDADLPNAAELLSRIEARPADRRPAVILLRSVVIGPHTVSSEHPGVVASLIKPVQPDEIRTVLNAVLAESGPGFADRPVPNPLSCDLSNRKDSISRIAESRATASDGRNRPLSIKRTACPAEAVRSDDSCPIVGRTSNGTIREIESFRFLSGATGKRFRILLAEDTVVNQFVATHLFEQAGIDVTVVSNGREAVAETLRERFDLVLMDMQMPELDGVSATEQIRRREAELGRRTPIVAMTARTRKEDRLRCEAAGMDGFLNKPLSLRQIEDTLRDLQNRGLLPPASFESKPEAQATGCEANPSLALQASIPNRPADDVLDEVAELFRVESVESLHAIRQAAAESDAAALESSAHSLKGAASCIGEDRLVELLYELERLGAACRLEAAGSVISQVETELQRILG